MFYNAHERERRYGELLRQMEPSPEFLGRCLRSHCDVSVSSALEQQPYPSPTQGTADGANGCANQPHVIPSPRTQTDSQSAVVATPARGLTP